MEMMRRHKPVPNLGRDHQPSQSYRRVVALARMASSECSPRSTILSVDKACPDAGDAGA